MMSPSFDYCPKKIFSSGKSIFQSFTLLCNTCKLITAKDFSEFKVRDRNAY